VRAATRGPYRAEGRANRQGRGQIPPPECPAGVRDPRQQQQQRHKAPHDGGEHTMDVIRMRQAWHDGVAIVDCARGPLVASVRQQSVVNEGVVDGRGEEGPQARELLRPSLVRGVDALCDERPRDRSLGGGGARGREG
jgi:hypothetical protein